MDLWNGSVSILSKLIAKLCSLQSHTSKCIGATCQYRHTFAQISLKYTVDELPFHKLSTSVRDVTHIVIRLVGAK